MNKTDAHDLVAVMYQYHRQLAVPILSTPLLIHGKTPEEVIQFTYVFMVAALKPGADEKRQLLRFRLDRCHRDLKQIMDWVQEHGDSDGLYYFERLGAIIGLLEAAF